MYPDLDPLFTPITGARVMVEAVARRLTTPRGSLVSDTDYGFDIRQLLNLDLAPREEARLLSQIRAQVEEDERVLSANVSILRAGDVLRVRVRFTTLEGPFAFTLALGQARILLTAGDA